MTDRGCGNAKKLHQIQASILKVWVLAVVPCSARGHPAAQFNGFELLIHDRAARAFPATPTCGRKFEAAADCAAVIFSRKIHVGSWRPEIGISWKWNKFYVEVPRIGKLCVEKRVMGIELSLSLSLPRDQVGENTIGTLNRWVILKSMFEVSGLVFSCIETKFCKKIFLGKHI